MQTQTRESKTLTLVETLTEENTGDGLMRPDLAWINKNTLLKHVRRLHQGPTCYFGAARQGSRDTTPQCTTTSHISLRACTT